MKLELTQKLQQQQVLAPQMILSMDILLLPTLDLEQRIEQEFAENPALEIAEDSIKPGDVDNRTEKPETGSEEFFRLSGFEEQPYSYYDSGRRKPSSTQENGKYEALQNSEGKPPGLKEALVQQLHLKKLSQEVLEASEAIVHNLDHRGYLLHSPDDLHASMKNAPTREIFHEALQAVRSLDPAGVGAENLQECLLLQLERDRQDYPVEMEIIRNHLEDLSMNKIPKIARDLGKNVEEIKEAVEIISLLDPMPGGRLETDRTIYIRPDVVVEIVGEDELEVRVEDQLLPRLQVSDSCRGLLKTSRGNRDVTSFLRKKIESAQWLIQAIQQRQKTIRDIARAVVAFQREFMLQGPEKLKALKMQQIADEVGVHISTISRAIKGKYMQTPWGLYEMRYFFTGGVGNADGEVESRRNVYRRIGEIIETEDKSKPYSDSEIACILREQGLRIARRTVTKYREQEKIPSSRLRKIY